MGFVVAYHGTALGFLTKVQGGLCRLVNIPFFFLINYYYFFLAMLDLCCCTWDFSSCGERGLFFVAVHGLLIAVASLVAEHGL